MHPGLRPSTCNQLKCRAGTKAEQAIPAKVLVCAVVRSDSRRRPRRLQLSRQDERPRPRAARVSTHLSVCICSDRLPRDKSCSQLQSSSERGVSTPKTRKALLGINWLNLVTKKQRRRSLMSANEFILLVDDDENDVLLLQRAFKKASLHDWLRVVTDGHEAISYLGGRGVYADRER